MENKVKFGQFYTKRSQYIIGNLIEDLDREMKVVAFLWRRRFVNF